jgi:pimeloyl-ACP methyl ester carboxylesterase
VAAASCVNPSEVLGGDDDPPVTIGSEAIGPTGGAAASEAGSTDEATRPESPPIEASFDEGPCPFDPIEGYEPRCGTVAVPMNWENWENRQSTDSGQSGRQVELAVAVFASTADDPAPDPVVYLEGGPGSHALDTLQFVTEDFLDPLTARGDVVVFDQRGAGYSTPRLSCDEVTEAGRELEDQRDVERDELLSRFRDALARCRNRLVDDGIDLAGYDSINNAHDVEAIRLALGYEQWNLFGISYGTKLGLEVLRRHPNGVRTAVLDSVYPPQVDSVLENPGTFLASYQRVIAACEAEAACRQAGDLAERIRALVQRYEDDPVRVGIVDWISGDEDEVWVDGDVIADIVTGALYSPSQFTDLPELVAELESGRTDAVSDFLSQDRTSERFFSDGMFYAIACREEISFADPEAVAAAVPADPFGLTESFDLASNIGNLAFATCEAFETVQAPAVSDTSVVSDVPTLVLAGAYDPITPVEWAERAAETLTNSWLVVGPAASHGVGTDACGISIVLAFLDQPGQRPDSECLDSDELLFVGAPTEPFEIEQATYPIGDTGYEIVTVRPVDWSVGALQGDQYRRASFLDPAELYQLAGNEDLGDALAGFIEDSHNLDIGSPEAFSGSIGPVDQPEGIAQGWRRRSGRGDSTAVEWFETEIEGFVVFVILVAPVEEYDAMVTDVLVPALQAVEVSRSF